MTLGEMVMRVRRRLHGAEADEALLMDLLADANALILTYTGRNDMPEALLPVQCQLAVLLYNRLGMEGESRRSEGSLSVTVDTLPADITAQLAQWRLARAVAL